MLIFHFGNKEIEKLKFQPQGGWVGEGGGPEDIHQLHCERLIQSESYIFNVLLCPYYHLQIIL